MREVTFKMERPGLVEVGQTVEITEIVSANYSYMIEPAVAMSGVFPNSKRIKAKTGVIKDIRKEERGYYVVAEFEE
ncbi:MAG: hypothetical protein KBT01_06300 [Clostridiales bacterium]|nr:hypothetical protein [Candidatus Blautia equi]